MCNCVNRTGRSCCPCVWQRCGVCAKHIFGVRILLVSLSIIDIIVMLWYIVVSVSDINDITNCCGIVHDPNPSINNSNIMDSYSECSKLDYANVIISDYSRFWFNAKKYNKINWNDFKSMVTYYDINVTVSSIGGCVVNQYDCFNDTVKQCVIEEHSNNETFADNINRQLQEMCSQTISDKEQLYSIGGILAIVITKICLIIIGICTKLYRNEFKPKNEAIHNLLHPINCPKLIEEKKNNAYDKMTDSNDELQNKKKLIFFYVLWNLIKYLFLFILLLLRFIYWILRNSYFIMLYTMNLGCSMILFFMHNSPILGIDAADFCVGSNINIEACTIGQNQCGIVNWILLPDVSKYLIPRYITLTVSILALTGRCIEKFAVCKLQDMIIKNDKNIRKQLYINGRLSMNE